MMKLGAADYLVKDLNFIDRLPGVLERAFRNIITEKRLSEAEEALRQSEGRLRLLFAGLPDVIVVVDKNGTYIEMAPAGTNSLYRNLDELPGKTLDEILPVELAERIHKIIKDVLKEGVSQDLDYELVIDGRKYWFAAIISPFSEETVLWITSDITCRKMAEEALRESEKRYKLTATLSGHIVYDYNVRENLMSWGGAIEEVSGYTPTEYEAIAISHWIERIHSEDRARTLEMFKQAIAKNIQFHTECRYQHKNGDYIWLEIHGFTLSVHNGEVYNTLGVIKDITQRKSHEQQVLNSVVNTEEHERISFSQELHDGLGPILSAIKMYIQWLGKPTLNIPTQEILKDLENLIDEAYNSVREISFRLSPHILKNYGLSDALRVYADRVKDATQIEFKFELDNHIRFDGIVETVIYRVLCECINNTIKHADANMIAIAIGVEKPYINVNFSDNGKGFDIDKIKGTYKGIGLLNMESRITSINGIMNIASNPGHGFHVNIRVKTSCV